MKIGDKVQLNGELGTIRFIDKPWNHVDGAPADLLCRVALDNSKDTHGIWCRLSEIELDVKN